MDYRQRRSDIEGMEMIVDAERIEKKMRLGKRYHANEGLSIRLRATRKKR